MGLFGSTKYCPVCGAQVKGHFNLKIKDNAMLCQQCSDQVFFMDPSMRPFQSVEDIKSFFSYRNKNKEIFQTFRTSREIPAGPLFFRIDESQHLWYCSRKTPANPPIFSYDEIIDYKLLENGETITKGGLGQAVAGGILFGNVGAVVGGVTGGRKSQTIVTSLALSISLNNIYNKQLSINFLTPGTKCKSNSITYNTCRNNANNVISMLDNMCHQATENSELPTATTAPLSPADEILKYKNLLDSGIITQEEFNKKKQQLSNL